MAILPARLDKEMGILKNALLNNEDVCLISEIEKHAQWVDSWKDNYNITKDNMDKIGETIEKVMNENSGLVCLIV